MQQYDLAVRVVNEPLTLSVSNECDRIAQISGGGEGLVSIRNHNTTKIRRSVNNYYSSGGA
jgi:hypothetical protein